MVDASPKGGSLARSISSGALRKSGEAISGTPSANTTQLGDDLPKIPRYLSVRGLTRRRKLSASTGNIHGYMAEDYTQLNWPLPKMFGYEKYGHSLIDIEDPRYVKDCAGMSKKLIRLQYDLQIVDLEWRNTYKKLLMAEHHMATLPENAAAKTKDIMKKEADVTMKYLLELQEQKDMYENQILEAYSKCQAIKTTIKKETDLEDLRGDMEKQTKDRIPRDSNFWRTRFNVKSPSHARSVTGASGDLAHI